MGKISEGRECESMELDAGTVVSERYRIVSVLGKGAMSTVYLVDDLAQPGARWALKEILSTLLDPAEQHDALAMFEQECGILKSLNHPGLPKVIDHFATDRGHCLVMEYVEGESLQARLVKRGRPFEVDEVLPWIIQINDILQYLHSQIPPVIFRDLKPSNIMITTRGRAKLIDFGIARHFAPEKVRDTFVMGTPGFSAPEQYGKKQTDSRSDLYSLGATAYFLVTGEDLEQFVFNVPPVNAYAAGAPPWFAGLLSRLLENDADKRFQSAASLKQYIEAHKGSTVSPPSPQAAPSPQAPLPPVSAPVTTTAPQKIIPFISSPWTAMVIFIMFLMMGCVPYVGPFFLIAGVIGILVLWFLSLCALVSSLVRADSDSAREAAKVLVGITLIIGLPALVIIPNIMRARSSGQLTGCKSNVKNIGTALEMYASDNDKLYPLTIEKVTPMYLKIIPTCPSAGRDTYRESYMLNAGRDAYTIYCRGSFHKEIMCGPDFPQYDSVQGLIEPAYR
ncbi:MAG: protein kinase [Candidatus Eremiobacteraeota bacterium]|nr:protein kinase [Candidatus Eremiobacteraeota bacterium]